MSDLYRITARTTSSLQPGSSFWNTEVLYCGYDRDEARRVFHESEPADNNRSFGNPARETHSEIIVDGDTAHFDDDELEAVEL